MFMKYIVKEIFSHDFLMNEWTSIEKSLLKQAFLDGIIEKEYHFRNENGKHDIFRGAAFQHVLL